MANRFQITDTMVSRLVESTLEDAGLDAQDWNGKDWDGMDTDHVMRLLRTRRQSIIAEAIVAVQQMRQRRPAVTDPAEQVPADDVDDLVQAMNAGLMADNIIANNQQESKR